MRAALSLLVVAALCMLAVATNNNYNKDVCVIGAGTGGITAAARLHELGYSVVVFEEEAEIGGCCTTVRFDPPPGETVSWLDVGVQNFLNTTKANAMGFGPWMDVIGWIRKYAGPDSIIVPPVSPTTPFYAADFKTGTNFGLQTPTAATPEFIDALTRYYGILAQYPWVDLIDIPEQIPAELLQPFSSFIINNQLEPLATTIFQSITYSGGLGYYDQLTSLYAVLGSGPTILLAVTDPEGSYALKGGCISYYNGVASSIGWHNVIRNANIQSVKRPNGSNGKVKVKGEVRTGAGKRNRRKFEYKCDHLVLGFSPALQDLGFMDLDRTERNLYGKVRTRSYAGSAVNIEGPLDDLGAYILINVDPSRQYGYAELPAPTALFRGLTFGPAQAPTVSNVPTTLEAMESVIQNSLSNLPPELVTSAEVVDVCLHVFQPHFVNSSLTSNPNPHTLLRSLEGYRKTYVVGAIDTFADSTHIIHRTVELIDAKFPPKN